MSSLAFSYNCHFPQQHFCTAHWLVSFPNMKSEGFVDNVFVSFWLYIGQQTLTHAMSCVTMSVWHGCWQPPKSAQDHINHQLQLHHTQWQKMAERSCTDTVQDETLQEQEDGPPMQPQLHCIQTQKKAKKLWHLVLTLKSMNPFKIGILDCPWYLHPQKVSLKLHAAYYGTHTHHFSCVPLLSELSTRNWYPNASCTTVIETWRALLHIS